MIRNYKTILLLLLFSSIAALTFAYISQYFFDLEPCILCLYQRKPFFAIIAITSLALFLKSEKIKKISIYLCAFLILVNSTIAIYHVLVEKKILQGPTTCSSSQNLNEITDLEDLKIALSKTKAIRCDEPAFIFLGISMAGWNLIYSLILLITIFYSKFKKVRQLSINR